MASASKPERVYLASGRKELQELITTCEAIRDRKFNPFFLDIKLALEILRKYFPHWKDFEDHCLDALAINMLSEVVRLQNSQLRFQSSTLYTDPEFLARKFVLMSEKRLAEIFLKTWHPILELEQYTLGAATEARDYWKLLAPIEERWRRFEMERSKLPLALGLEAAVEMGLMTREEFTRRLQRLWEDMKREAKAAGKIGYWKFIRRGDFRDTVQRAYYVSFLVTYGYAKLTEDKNNLYLTPAEEVEARRPESVVSLPISIKAEAGS